MRKQTAPASRVFVVQDTDLNLAKATRFGELVALLPRRRNITLATVPVLSELRLKLKDFNDADFILPVGDPVAIVLTGLIAAEMNHGRLQLLKWDREMNDYYGVAVNIYAKPKPLGA